MNPNNAQAATSIQNRRLCEFLQYMLTQDEHERRIVAFIVAAWTSASEGTSDWDVAMERYLRADQARAEGLARRR